jgi:hypothetical protein
MKFLNRFLLLVAVLYVCASVWPVIAAEADVDEAVEEEATIPDSTDMTLGVKDNPYILPEDFRGGDPDTSLVHCLEDVYYEKQEHSLIYNPDAEALAEGAEFESDPNITWETKVKNEDGTYTTLSSENTNMAADGGKFYAPGTYMISNSGARQVGEGEGGAAGETGADDEDAEDGAAEGGETAEGPVVGEDGEADEAAGGTKTVTAEQNMGVKVHDCTSPDLWVAFQEGAGKVDMAETKAELESEMKFKIIANLGRPFSHNADDFEQASYLFIDEGKDDERNVEPWKKISRVSIAGPLFNERGMPSFETGAIDAKQVEDEYKTQVHVAGGAEKPLKGVFVRRNVPFIFAGMSIDNGNNRQSVGEVEFEIENAEDEKVKDGEAYLFRVPNYPREKYADQPDYYFLAKSFDKDGNMTTVRMPLYVVDTQAAFEGGRNQ